MVNVEKIHLKHSLKSQLLVILVNELRVAYVQLCHNHYLPFYYIQMIFTP